MAWLLLISHSINVQRRFGGWEAMSQNQVDSGLLVLNSSTGELAHQFWVITLFVFARWEEGAAAVVPMGFSSVERLLCAWH